MAINEMAMLKLKLEAEMDKGNFPNQCSGHLSQCSAIVEITLYPVVFTVRVFICFHKFIMPYPIL